MNIFFICRASPPVWVYSTHCAVCTIDTTGGISYSTALPMRYVMVVDSAVTVCVVL